MKTQMLIVSPHSIIDLITNSSSELFVSNTQKTVEAVKEIIVELCKIHNQREKLSEHPNLIDLDKIFITYFKEPEISEYDFSPYLGFNRDEHFDNDREKEMMEEWERKNPFKTKWLNHDTATKKQKKIFNDKRKKYEKKRDDIEKKIFSWYDKYNRPQVLNYLNDICSRNGFTIKDLGKIKINWNSYRSNPYLDFPDIIGCEAKKNLPKNLVKFVKDFEYNYSWGIQAGKGNILIRSQEDNSIPYGMFEDLRNIFHAQRHHLG